MFETLTDRLSDVFSKLRGRGKLTEADVEEGLREIRRAFLEADVNLKVTRALVDSIREKAIGSSILQTLTPDQMLVKIVNDEIVLLLGTTLETVTYVPSPPTIVVMLGLQGSGKTTSTVKLACALRKDGHRPIVIGADIHRPAAGEQLTKLAKEVDIPVTVAGLGETAHGIAKRSLQSASQFNCDVILIDTAGRLQIDHEMLGELKEIVAAVPVHQKILVIDAMTGQESVNVGQGFHEAVGVDGIIMTKLDGDARGGAALSIRAAIGVPIMYCGTGEKLKDLEVFDPTRMASRIVGMGDVLTLIERAQENVDQQHSEEMAQRMLAGAFTFDDWLEQMRSVKQMGSLESIIGMLPGNIGKQLKQAGQVIPSEEELKHMEAIVLSMTRQERTHPDIISWKRKKRIALGSGTAVPDVNRMLKNFEQARSLAKMLGGGQKGGKKMRKAMKLLNNGDMQDLLGKGSMQ